MTNHEKYKKEIVAIIESGDDIAIIGGKPVNCSDATCSECDLLYRCGTKLVEWMNAEYEGNENE